LANLFTITTTARHFTATGRLFGLSLGLGRVATSTSCAMLIVIVIALESRK
jgi:hypothetical protein